MSTSTFFVQQCPTCGRSLRVLVEYLGKKVVCQHCRGQFQAHDSSTTASAPPQAADALLRKADQLLESANARKSRPR